MKINIGNPAVLVCEYEGNPLPRVHWLAGNIIVKDHMEFDDYSMSTTTTAFSSKLTIMDSKGSKRREFSCIAQNGFSSANKTFTVECKCRYTYV